MLPIFLTKINPIIKTSVFSLFIFHTSLTLADQPSPANSDSGSLVSVTSNSSGSSIDSRLNSQLSVVSGEDSIGHNGYYVLFEKKNDVWSILNIYNDPSQITETSKPNIEILHFSEDLKQVIPKFSSANFVRYGSANERSYDKSNYECSTMDFKDNDRPDKVGYNPCHSTLTKTHVVGAIARNAFVTVFSLGTNLLVGSTLRVVSVDKDKVLSLIKQTNTWSKIKEYQLQEYRSYLLNANNSRTYNAFINRYTANDPDNLIPQAIISRDKLQASEDKVMQEYNAKAAKENQLRKLEADRRQVALNQENQVRKDREFSKLQVFRKSLKTESETNCGPVIEIKGSLIKVYSPIANYGNEHWIKRDQLFTTDYNCNFLNGDYRPPSF